jgi:hypothetical protein
MVDFKRLIKSKQAVREKLIRYIAKLTKKLNMILSQKKKRDQNIIKLNGTNLFII